MMKYIGENKSGDPVFEIPEHPLVAMNRERKTKERAAAAENERKHTEAMKLARSSTRAAWFAVLISLLALLASIVALYLA